MPGPGTRGEGKNPERYSGPTGCNNPQNLPYDEQQKEYLKADFIEILCHGYTVERAGRLLIHWATSADYHVTILNERVEEPHWSYGRAVPSRKQFYFWRNDDKEFAEAWDEAFLIRGTEALEDHATDMAYAGNDKLVMFLLKARNPQKFANFGALGGGSFNVTISPADENL